MRPPVIEVPADGGGATRSSLRTCEGASSTSSSGSWSCSRPSTRLSSRTAGLLDAYNAASKDEAEELYGDYVDHVDSARDALLGFRYAYASTLDDEAADEYEEVFNRLARKRLPSLGSSSTDYSSSASRWNGGDEVQRGATAIASRRKKPCGARPATRRVKRVDGAPHVLAALLPLHRGPHDEAAEVTNRLRGSAR